MTKLDPAGTKTLRQTIRLDCGKELENIEIAYVSLGRVRPDAANLILVCHALTGDQHVAGIHPKTGKPGWWSNVVGPGLPLDTDRFQIVCMNVLGGCSGTTGPGHMAPDGMPYGTRFPVITVADMVRVQRAFLEELGINEIFCVIGGSMGGMQALEWAIQAPKSVPLIVPIATTARSSAQNIAFYEVGRQAIMADMQWQGGEYSKAGVSPDKGMAVARMAASITYVSEDALKRKFDRAYQGRDAASYSFEADFQIESWLRHMGKSFPARFDANSYLYVTRAMDYFDIAARFNGRLPDAFRQTQARFGVFSFSSDWHYPPHEARTLTRGLVAAGVKVSHMEIKTDKGHDAFLLDEPGFQASLKGLIGSSAGELGL